MKRAWLAPFLVVAACRGRGGPDISLPNSPAPERTLIEMRLERLPPESRRASLGPDVGTLADLVGRIDQVASRDEEHGLFLRVGPLHGGGRIDEVTAALGRVRAARKPVHCHVELADNASYALLARACDRLTMTPAGHLAVVGVAAHLTSIRELLANVGVRVEMVQAGDAKGAADPFTRDEPTPEHRENVQALVADLERRLVTRMAARTHRAPDQIEALLREAPFTSSQAHAFGLVDDVEFDDEAREHARTAASATRVVDQTPGEHGGPRSLAELVEVLSSPGTDTSPEAPHVVVARLHGTIVDGPRSTGDTVASEPFVEAMRRFANDPDVKAVVIRIDSPGGSALASDRMWHAVSRLALRKPVIASVGDMAASGGYYVACAARTIYANEGSIVGSIGVVAGRPDLSGLLERLGVHVTTIAAAPSADLFSPFRPLTTGERARFERSASEAYERFLSRVTAGRPSVKVPDAVEGRVFIGSAAVDLGLVDSLGGLEEATARARQLGGLGVDAPIATWPGPVGLLEALLGSEYEGAHAITLDPAIAALVRSLESEPLTPTAPRAALPYAIDVR